MVFSCSPLEDDVDESGWTKESDAIGRGFMSTEARLRKSKNTGEDHDQATNLLRVQNVNRSANELDYFNGSDAGDQ